MRSILKCISEKDPYLQTIPRDPPIKENPINKLIKQGDVMSSNNPESALGEISTGFGANNELYYKTKCTKPVLKTPLYKENYLQEFVTAEEKAAARRALGLYNKEDIVAMSLLHTSDNFPSDKEWAEATIKQLRQGDVFFTPLTSTAAVYDSEGISLESKLKNLTDSITAQEKELKKITQLSNSNTITSLGDVTKFLQGFNNGDNLHDINKDFLKFEKIGEIV